MTDQQRKPNPEDPQSYVNFFAEMMQLASLSLGEDTPLASDLWPLVQKVVLTAETHDFFASDPDAQRLLFSIQSVVGRAMKPDGLDQDAILTLCNYFTTLCQHASQIKLSHYVALADSPRKQTLWEGDYPNDVLALRAKHKALKDDTNKHSTLYRKVEEKE